MARCARNDAQDAGAPGSSDVVCGKKRRAAVAHTVSRRAATRKKRRSAGNQLQGDYERRDENGEHNRVGDFLANEHVPSILALKTRSIVASFPGKREPVIATMLARSAYSRTAQALAKSAMSLVAQDRDTFSVFPTRSNSGAPVSGANLALEKRQRDFYVRRRGTWRLFVIYAE